MSTSRIAGIVERFQGRFQSENYGYGHAIRRGEIKIKVQNGRLEVIPPANSFDSASPLYCCTSTSLLVTRECTRAGLSAGVAKITIPITPSTDNESMVHRVAYVQEGNESFFVGLTPPFDGPLGLFPYKNINKVAWILPYVDRTMVNPFLESEDAPILEKIPWILNDPIGTSIVNPLFARPIGTDKLGISELGIRLVRDYFSLCLISKILVFDRGSKAFRMLWNTNLEMNFPVGRLESTTEELLPFENSLLGAAELLISKNMLYQEDRVRSPLFHKDGMSLLHEAWPTVVTLLQKIPMDDLRVLMYAFW